MDVYDNVHLPVDSKEIQPKSLKKFNWGAFVMWNLWGIFNFVPMLIFLLWPELYIVLGYIETQVVVEPIDFILISIVIDLQFFNPILILLIYYWNFNESKIALKNDLFDSVEIQLKSLKKFNWGAFVMWNLWGIFNFVPMLMFLLWPELYIVLGYRETQVVVEPIDSILISIVIVLQIFNPILILSIYYCNFNESKIALKNEQVRSVEYSDKNSVRPGYNKKIGKICEQKEISLYETSNIATTINKFNEVVQHSKVMNLSEEVKEKLKETKKETKNELNNKYKETELSEEWQELRVDYSAPKEYLQMDNWVYVVSKFPETGTILYPYRRRQNARIGHMEPIFFEQLLQWLPKQIQPIHDICVKICEDVRPYEPDIALFINGYDTIRIDVEIDEPYTAFTKEPIHYIGCGDDYRDDLLNRLGWIVVRFAEEQIKKYPKSCALYLVKLINSLLPEIIIPTDLLDANPLPPMKRWTKNEATIMAANRERERYLEHEFSVTEEKVMELPNTTLNENERSCRLLVKPSAMGKVVAKNVINFIDSDIYERDNDINFIPFEHIYIYKDLKQLLPVSSLVEYFFEKFNALEQAVVKSQRCHMPVEYYLKQWDKIGKMAREVGMFVHLQIGNYFKNGKFETEYKFEYEGKVETINVIKEKEHFLNFIRDFSIIPYRQEWSIYDIDLNIAGTIDLICKEDNGEYSIYDWKRSSKIVNILGQINDRGFNDKMSFNGITVPDTAYYHYCIQQNLYRYMLEKNYEIKIKSMSLVVLCPNYLKYYKVNVPIMDEVIDAIISICKEKKLGHKLLILDN